MSVSANKSRLTAATQDLWRKWQETRESWRDAKALEFQHKYLDELFNSVNASGAAMDELEKLVQKVKSDCE